MVDVEAYSIEEELDTQGKILQSAIHLIRSRSFNSFSYNDIAEIINIKKASIHYHFDTKSTLGIAVIQEYRSKAEYLMEKLENIEDDPKIRLDLYFDFFRNGLLKGEICLVGVMTTEFNTVSKDIQDELLSFFNYHFEWLTEILEDGKRKNVFHYDVSSYDKALYITSAVEGALLIARAYDKNYFETVVNQIKLELINN